MSIVGDVAPHDKTHLSCRTLAIDSTNPDDVENRCPGQDHVQDPETPAVLKSIMHEVEAPLFVRTLVVRRGLRGGRRRPAAFLQRGSPGRKHLPIRSEWKLSTLDGPTTTESKKQSANPETEISSPS
jgi:hypothetical protein